MGRRQDLNTLLKTMSDNVYFQPPDNIQMVYPCIVYMRDLIRTNFADNFGYHFTKRYQVTLISRDPDNPVVDMVAALPLSIFGQHFVTENLHHDVFSLYF